MVVAGHEPTKKHLDRTLRIASAVAGTEIPVDAVHSTIGRIAARAVRCAVLLDELKAQWQLLIDNITKGDMATFDPQVFPKGEVAGVGFHEAPRGVLSHWIVIEDGKIKNYQAVVPSTWNAGPRMTMTSPAHTKRRLSTIRWPIRISRWKCCARCTPSIRASPARYTSPIPSAARSYR